MITTLRRAATASLLLSMSTVAASAAEVKLDTDNAKTIYAIGVVISRQLSAFNLTPAELDLVLAALSDATLNKPLQVDLETYGPKIQPLAQERQAAQAAVEKGKSEVFLAEQAKVKGAVKLESGVIMTEIKPGTGPSPAATDTVKVHYHGTLRDGTVFDSSVDRGDPAQFALNQVIPCWTEGVGKMKVGGKSKLICPADKAYGDRGAPPKILPGATLAFEVELLEIVKPAAAAAPK